MEMKKIELYVLAIVGVTIAMTTTQAMAEDGSRLWLR